MSQIPRGTKGFVPVWGHCVPVGDKSPYVVEGAFVSPSRTGRNTEKGQKANEGRTQ